jgi:thiosulfate dehydrogenase
MVSTTTNGMNCQNCHLDAGTKIYGNNYSAVASTYPKMLTRSGTIGSIEKRVSDCFERSLNGISPASDSKEMKAIVAYINWLGADVPKGKTPSGASILNLEYLDRAADPEKGKLVYNTKCRSCHAENGEGKLAGDGKTYQYPPLWGNHSYNTGAGIFRLTRFAGYVKTNMPMGATFYSQQLSDEESWDVAAYVNSQPRPEKLFPKDWPDLSKKPIDNPFGPYADDFPEEQHKFGPYTQMKGK